jgi:peroxiredoxin
MCTNPSAMMFRTFVSVIVTLLFFPLFPIHAQNAQVDMEIVGLSSMPVTIELYAQSATRVFQGNTDATGRVSATFAVPAPGFYKVTLERNRDFFLVLAPGDRITLKTTLNNFIGSMEVKGSESNAAHLRVRAVTDSLRRVMAQLEEEHKRLSQQPEANRQRLEEIVQLHAGLQVQRTTTFRRFMAENPSSLAVLFFTGDVKSEDDPALYDHILQTLLKHYPDNFYVQDLRRKVEVEKITRIGAVAPDIALPDPHGDTIRLSSLRGNIVLLDFWAAWCGPCRRENPHLVRIYDKYKEKGFEIYGVSLDRDRASWMRGIQEDKLTWSLVSDLSYFSSAPAQLYGVTSIPYAILLDREGRILAKSVRAHQLEAMLEQILAAEQGN